MKVQMPHVRGEAGDKCEAGAEQKGGKSHVRTYRYSTGRIWGQIPSGDDASVKHRKNPNCRHEIPRDGLNHVPRNPQFLLTNTNSLVADIDDQLQSALVQSNTTRLTSHSGREFCLCSVGHLFQSLDHFRGIRQGFPVVLVRDPEGGFEDESPFAEELGPAVAGDDLVPPFLEGAAAGLVDVDEVGVGRLWEIKAWEGGEGSSVYGVCEDWRRL